MLFFFLQDLHSESALERSWCFAKAWCGNHWLHVSPSEYAPVIYNQSVNFLSTCELNGQVSSNLPARMDRNGSFYAHPIDKEKVKEIEKNLGVKAGKSWKLQTM